MEAIGLAVTPFILADIVALACMVVFPAGVTWLPSFMGRPTQEHHGICSSGLLWWKARNNPGK
jgi:hypothetical protein